MKPSAPYSSAFFFSTCSRLRSSAGADEFGVRYAWAITRAKSRPPQGNSRLRSTPSTSRSPRRRSLGEAVSFAACLRRHDALVSGEWTDRDGFRCVARYPIHSRHHDSAKPYSVRLEQIYSPSIALQRPLHRTCCGCGSGRPRGAGFTAQPGDVVERLGHVRWCRPSIFGTRRSRLISTCRGGRRRLPTERRRARRGAALGTSTLAVALLKGLTESSLDSKQRAAGV